MTHPKRPFLKLGRALSDGRIAADIKTQRDLAGLLGFSQQSVSRWEAGTHRPSPEQLTRLTELLELNRGDLRQLAGYDSPPALSFVVPFPVDLLSPEDFEQFVAHAAAEGLLPGSKLRRAGKTGHTQGGVDIEATMPDGSRVIIQCKRALRFGPADVRAASAAISIPADRKILALSRVASPQAASAAREAGFELWDRDDISRRIRMELSPPAQERLVDAFFRGQREVLLGTHEPGPWMSPDEFFRPFTGNARAFNHSWALVGREQELDDLQGAISGAPPCVGMLVAPGGMGKSRLLIELGQRLSGTGIELHFLSTTAEIKRQDLLRLGPGSKLLVVDDAHDRDGLGALFEYVADPGRRTRLLLATRPYAKDRILGEAVVFGLPEPKQITLAPLAKPRLIEMTEQVLEAYDASPGLAEMIVNGAGASPLVATMAARVVAREGIPMELAKSQTELRGYILQKFAKVVTGELGARGEEDTLREILRVLAIVQPFHPEDNMLLGLIETVLGIRPDAAARAMRGLVDGGIAYRRGSRWRLMPDVLGDYLIETSCLDSSKSLSPFALKVLEAVPPAMLTNVLVNLGRLDWRMNDGDTEKSRLLEQAWRSVDGIEDEWDQRFGAVKAVAAYQPQQAMDFVSRQLRRGRRFSALSEILRNVAFGSGKLGEPAMLLWEMGRDDVRELGPHPNHPMRVLSELCGYHPQRSLAFPEQALEFGLSLMEEKDSWSGRFTPLDVIVPLLSTEGMNTESNGRTFSFSPYFINYEAARPYRRVVIDKILELLRDPRLHVSVAAANHLSETLRGPIGMMNSTPPKGTGVTYDAEYLDTLIRLEGVVVEGVAPLVAVMIERAMAWRARHGSQATAKAARRVLNALDRSLEFKLRDALFGSTADRFLDDECSTDWRKNLDDWLIQLARDFQQAFPEPMERREQIEALLEECAIAGLTRENPYQLIHPLLRDDTPLAITMLADALSRPNSRTREHVRLALSKVLAEDKSVGHFWIERLVADGAPDLAVAAALGLSAIMEPDEHDILVLVRLIGSPHREVVHAAMQTASWSNLNDDRKITVLLKARIDGDSGLADRLASSLMSARQELVERMDGHQVQHVLDSLTPVDRFDGYWVDKLLAALSFSNPREVASFFRRRVELAAGREDYSMRAANTGPYAHDTLRIADTPDAAEILDEMWTWLRANNNRGYIFMSAAMTVMEAIFPPQTDLVIDFMKSKQAGADSDELMLMARLIRRAHHSFAFDKAQFVIAFLERCQSVDLELVDDAVTEIYCGASGGMRSGVMGEPMPRDLDDRDRAKAILAKLSRLSPAYELYDDLRRHAEDSIQRTSRDAEAFDDE